MGGSRAAREAPASAPSGEPAGRAPRVVPAVAFLAVLAVGFVSALLAPALRSPPEGDLLDGSWTSALEAGLMEDTALADVASAAWGAIDYAVFRQGLPGVLVGRDGWLFSTEEFARDEVEARFTVERPVREIAAAARRLEADGVDLVVVPVPAKARMEPEALGRYVLPPAAAARYDALLAALRREGVRVTDAAVAMARAGEDGPVFLRTDTHWTPAGAAAVADATAALAAERHGDAAWFGATDYELVAEGERTVEGDLLAFVPLGPFAPALGPEPDRVPSWRAVAQDAGGDLFGDPDLPVTLVGTSYSADGRWAFADRLRVALGTDVLVAATEGEGPYAPMTSYLEGEAYANARPELVIWEIPERYAWPEGAP